VLRDERYPWIETQAGLARIIHESGA